MPAVAVRRLSWLLGVRCEIVCGTKSSQANVVGVVKRSNTSWQGESILYCRAI